jgi:hypothetical protein
MHAVDAAVVCPSNGVNAPVGELVVIHWASLPLPFRLANADPAFEIVRHRLQMLKQRLLLGVDHGDQLLVIGPTAAWRARWQGRKRSGIAAATQLLP